jgi:hypothetical protein
MSACVLCSCGAQVGPEHRLPAHQFDGRAYSVLELRNCPSCRSTVSKSVRVDRLGCACKGCSAARAERRVLTAPTVGEEFRRLRLSHRMKGPIHV